MMPADEVCVDAAKWSAIVRLVAEARLAANLLRTRTLMADLPLEAAIMEVEALLAAVERGEGAGDE